MTIINPKDANHKAWLMRVLTEIVDDQFLAEQLRFKGGTCASMLGYLDRFSVDLDFDILDETQTDLIRQKMKKIFTNLNLEIKDESKRVVEFLLRYPAPINDRNSLRVDMVGKNYLENIYENQFLPEINRYFGCQTVETMFSHKLIALMERYDKHQTIAGRDVYDIHYFFFSGRLYRKEIIKERTGKNLPQFFTDLKEFLEKQVNPDLLVQDLGTLLPSDKMRFVKKNLLVETKMFIENAILSSA